MSSQTARPDSLPPTTTSSSAQFVEKFISVIASAYDQTPLTIAFITEIDKTPPPYPSPTVNHARRVAHFTPGITAAARSNVILVESGNWAACALWEPPDFCGTPIGHIRRVAGPILQEWRNTARQMKGDHLALPDTGPRSMDTPASPSQSSAGPSEDPFPTVFNKPDESEIRPFYHLAFLARNPNFEEGPETTTQHAVAACILPFLKRARDEGVPAWLEANTPHAVEVYRHFGFRICEEVRIGVGRVNGEGWPMEGGEGVKCWGMIYDPHLR